MRFNGKSGVEVRLPNDLEDLKGYTSLSLFLQRPESREYGRTENMFVMYLGNKDVGIALTFLLFGLGIFFFFNIGSIFAA